MYYLLGLNSLYFDQGKISIGINYDDIGVNYPLKSFMGWVMVQSRGHKHPKPFLLE
jgi:hypothetical protein